MTLNELLDSGRKLEKRSDSVTSSRPGQNEFVEKALKSLKRQGLGSAECVFSEYGLVITGPKCRYKFPGIYEASSVAAPTTTWHPLRKRLISALGYESFFKGDNVTAGTALSISDCWLLETRTTAEDRTDCGYIEYIRSINDWVRKYPVRGGTFQVVLPVSIAKIKPPKRDKNDIPHISFRKISPGLLGIFDYKDNKMSEIVMDVPERFERIDYAMKFFNACTIGVKSPSYFAEPSLLVTLPIESRNYCVIDGPDFRVLLMPVRH